MFTLIAIVVLLVCIILFVNKIKARSKPITLETYIQNRVHCGESKETVKADLLKDLEVGGPILGEFRSTIKATANGVINNMRDSGEFSELGYNANYRWVAILVNTCPDCIERHGKIKTWEEWEKDGLPRTGHTACKNECKCVLLPADTKVLESIRSEKKSKIRK